MQKGEEIVSARKSRFESEVRGPVIFCPVGPYVTLAAKLLRAKKSPRPLIPGRVYHVRRGTKEVTLYGPGQSAPMAVMALERCAAQGCRYFIMLGVCGSLRSEVKTGDFIIPVSSLIEEGTSAHYNPSEHPAEAAPGVVEALRKALQSEGAEWHEGRVWTTDAIYRETKSKVREYGEAGMLGVEMEVSALFTAGGYRGVEVGALLVVSDELFDLKWRPGFSSPRFLNNLRRAVKISLNAALGLCESPEP